MSTAQTEALAIALKAASHVRNNADAKAVENIVTRYVSTALDAKEAELAEVKAKNATNAELADIWAKKLDAAETQLAEANKAHEISEADIESICMEHNRPAVTNWVTRDQVRRIVQIISRRVRNGGKV